MSKVTYQNALPSKKSIYEKLKVRRVVLIYDRKLSRHDFFNQWADGFDASIAVTAGERLKQVDSFAKYSQQALKFIESFSRQEVAIVAVGGGSVGDFAGFVASVLKRGVVFANIPSTWLAAIDSAHGGKTALNLGKTKNQIGTFYEAKNVWICKKLLESSGKKNADAAMGEVIKTILIAGGPVYRHLSMSIKLHQFKTWKALPFLVKAKMKVVEKDFDESRGHRQILNLGHTLGHIIEAEKNVSHGLAVLMGVRFAINWSSCLQLMPRSTYMKIMNLLDTNPIEIPRLRASRVSTLLVKDKKAENKKIRFVFLRKPGELVVRPVTVSAFITECKRQGILR